MDNLMHYFFLIVLLFLTSCSVPKTDFRDRFAVANNYFPEYHEFYYIRSQGLLADRAFIKMLRKNQSCEDSKRLSNLMKEGSEKLTRLSVSSPAEEKAALIIQQATSYLSGEHLPYLELLYIGEQKFAPSLKESIETLGGRFLFEKL